MDAARWRVAIEEAELAAKSGKPKHAIEILSHLDRPPGSYERQLFLTAAMEAQQWATVIEATNPPTTINELIQHLEACSRLGKCPDATAALDKYSQQLHLDHTLETELRQRISAEETIRE
jgi:hypothetical protein